MKVIKKFQEEKNNKFYNGTLIEGLSGFLENGIVLAVSGKKLLVKARYLDEILTFVYTNVNTENFFPGNKIDTNSTPLFKNDISKPVKVTITRLDIRNIRNIDYITREELKYYENPQVYISKIQSNIVKSK